MVCLTAKPTPIYRPRRPRQSPLFRTIERYLPEFERTYDWRYAKHYGPWRPIIGEVARRFLRCGDLHYGFARVRCPDCRHEMFVAFSCQQRCLCPSCHQKRTLVTAETIAGTICAPVPHRQLVFTIPKRLRVYCRHDRSLLGKLARAAWQATVEVYRQVLGRRDALPGMVAGIQTFGELINFHPHIHAIATDGVFTADGTFLCLPRVDKQLLLEVWKNKVFELFVAQGKLDPETAERMRCWPHSGFSVDNSVYVAPHDIAGLQRLAEYILRCPFSLARVVRLTEDGSVIYRAEKDHCRRFPGPASRDLRGGPKRNFQVFSALDFLAEVTQHIPERGEHLVRYYGWYSHRQRGIRKRTRQVGQVESDKLTIDRSALDAQTPATGGALSAWAMLIKRVYEVDPLECPYCGGQMKIVSFIERCHRDVIEQILRHCGLWQGPLRTRPGARPPPQSTAGATAQHDLQFVPDPEYQEAEYLESDPKEGTGELQLVLDPELL